MPPLRFGILGSGFMGRTHAEAIRQLPGRATLAAIAGGSRAPGLAQRFGIAEEPTAEALLARPDIDAIVVTTPHHLHVDATEFALRAGKHALVEKPLATTVADCDRMIAAAQASGRILAVGYHQRFRPNNRAAHDLVRAGAIGELKTVLVSMPTPMVTGRSNFGSDWAWWNDPASVGHMINSLPHGIDLLRWCTKKEIATVTAFARTLLPGIDVEDTTLALAEFAGGPIVSFFSSRALPHGSFPGEGFRLRMVGSAGLIDLDPYDELRLCDAQGWRTVSRQPAVGHESADTAFGPGRMQAYRDQILAFLAAVEGPPAVPALPAVGTGQDGRIAVAVCRAMLDSSAQRRWIDLAP